MSATILMPESFIGSEVKEVKREAVVDARVRAIACSQIFDGVVLSVIGIILAAITFAIAGTTPGGMFLTVFVSFGGTVCGPMQLVSGLWKMAA